MKVNVLNSFALLASVFALNAVSAQEKKVDSPNKVIQVSAPIQQNLSDIVREDSVSKNVKHESTLSKPTNAVTREKEQPKSINSNPKK
jgi:hypothetical protein